MTLLLTRGRPRSGSGAHGQTGEFGPAAVPGLVANAVEMGADSPYADEEFLGDLVVGQTFCDERHEFPFPFAELGAGRCLAIAGRGNACDERGSGVLDGFGEGHHRASLLGEVGAFGAEHFPDVAAGLYHKVGFVETALVGVTDM